ncbi:MAG TPA: pitrilysin family protein [Vicinamibacteria bacterium]|nr:pitrilysin family protein [Vicinamibacteria bacterium]
MRATAAAAVVALLPAVLAAQPADRRPPSPEPPRALKLPPVQKLALGNGLPVHLVEAHEVPVVEVTLVVRSGSSADPRGRAGLATFTADMLDEGAGGRDALALADAVDFLGAEITAAASWDHSVVGLYVPVARLEEALALMADVALRPAFPEKETERLRRQGLTSLLQARADPRQVASWALVQALFGKDHRYGRLASGDAASLSAMTVADVRTFHTRHYRPGNAALVVVGDVDRGVMPLLEEAFGAWPRGDTPAQPVPEPPQVKGRRIVLVDKPGAAQSVIRIGRVGPPRRTPEHHAIEVMNTLLGASFTSRLNDNLREQHGYAYGAGSGFNYRLVAGQFLAAADVQTPSTAPALTEFLKELERIRTPAAAEEIERARNYLALGFAEEFETVRQIAAKVAEQIVYLLPEDYYLTFVPAALAVDVEQARAAAAATIDPAHLVIVVVGDRQVIEAPLRALDVATIEVRTLDEVMGPPPRVE